MAILGVAATLLFVGMLIRGRKQQQRTKTERVLQQARQLGDQVSERAPEVDELRDKLRSLGDARITALPNTTRIVGAAATLLSIGILLRKRKRTKSKQVVNQARDLSGEITELIPKLDELRTRLRSLDRDERGKRRGSTSDSA